MKESKRTAITIDWSGNDLDGKTFWDFLTEGIRVGDTISGKNIRRLLRGIQPDVISEMSAFDWEVTLLENNAERTITIKKK